MGQSILVTGSSSGIGRRISETLAEQGHMVFAGIRNTRTKNAAVAGALSDWAQENTLDLQVIDMDVTDDSSVQQAVEQVIERAGRIDVLVNNAGAMLIGLSEACTLDQMRQIYEVNLFGTLRTNLAVLPHMRKQGAGLLMYMSSGSASLIYPFLGAYGSSKAALEFMAETLHYEVYRLGIDTTIFQAGSFATSLGANIQTAAGQQVSEAYGPVGQMAQSFAQSFSYALSGEYADNPQNLADMVAQIVQLPAGQRPLKVPIGFFIEGVVAINQITQPVRQQVLSGLQLDMLLQRD